MPETELAELRQLLLLAHQDRDKLQYHLNKMQEEVAWILKMLRGDNGTGANGLMTRFVLMENRMAEQRDQLSRILKLLEEQTNESVKGRWQLATAVGIAFFGTLAAC